MIFSDYSPFPNNSFSTKDNSIYAISYLLLKLDYPYLLYEKYLGMNAGSIPSNMRCLHGTKKAAFRPPSFLLKKDLEMITSPHQESQLIHAVALNTHRPKVV
jgi:hypothetical protein